MTASWDSVTTTEAAARAASSKFATDIVALDVSSQFPLADVFLLCSARNERMALSIADAVEEVLAKKNIRALRQEGRSEGRWVLLDFGDLIVHIFHEEERLYYQLERLWKDCPVVPTPVDETAQPDSESELGL
jgi:ribosome-associated protein